MEYHLMFVWKQEVIFCFGSYLSQNLMDFASIWVILKGKSCWATISEYIRNPNMKLNEYGISEYAKNPYPLDALMAALWRHEALSGRAYLPVSLQQPWHFVPVCHNIRCHNNREGLYWDTTFTLHASIPRRFRLRYLQGPSSHSIDCERTDGRRL